MTKPDTICEEYVDRYPRTKHLPRLTVKLAPQIDDTVLIEGAPAALEFLGNLLLAQATYEDCGFQLGPRASGSLFFSKDSTLNLYIHRLPCNDSRHRLPARKISKKPAKTRRRDGQEK
jgi:hypothetical protein